AGRRIAASYRHRAGRPGRRRMLSSTALTPPRMPGPPERAAREEDDPPLRTARRRAHRRAQDGRVPLSRARALARALRRHRGAVVRGAGHLARTEAHTPPREAGGEGGPRTGR